MDLYTFVGTTYVNGTFEPVTLEVGGSYSMGDFSSFRANLDDLNSYSKESREALRKTLYVQPREMSGSDYCGGIAERSNFLVFMKKFKDIEGVYETYGGYNSYGVAIRLDVFENNSEIKEIFSDLEGYGVIDDEAYSELQNELEEEFIQSEVSFFCSQINLEEYIPEIETILEDTDTIKEYMWEGIRDLEIEFRYEYLSAYINLYEIKPYVEDRLILAHAKQLPLFINRDWSCDQTRNAFSEKFTQ